MGFIPSSCRLLIQAHKQIHFQGPVLTLGNQDIWADYNQLEHFFREMDCPYVNVTPTPHTSLFFKTYPPLIAKTKKFVHAKTFFRMLGIDEYWDMDKLADDQPQILHDLNNPVPPKYHRRFNLIVDGGTIEHIFDIRQTMENLVQMCKPSGWVVHLSPASNFLDHGLYSFSPCFFFDFYQANGFGDLMCYLWQTSTDQIKYFDPCPYFEYTYGMNLGGLLDPNKQTLVFFAAKKMVALDELVIPSQRVYAENPIPVPATPQTQPPTFARLVPHFAQPVWKLTRLVLAPVLPFLSRARRKLIPQYRLLKKI